MFKNVEKRSNPKFKNVPKSVKKIYLFYSAQKNVEKSSKMFENVHNQNVQKCSKIYQLSQKVQKCSKMFKNVPKCSKMFQNVQKCSKMFKNVQKRSAIFAFGSSPLASAYCTDALTALGRHLPNPLLLSPSHVSPPAYVLTPFHSFNII